MKNNKTIVALAFIFSVSIIACKKTPPSTEADGWVMCIDDSTAVAGANIKIAHWDGSQKSDTNIVSSRLADSLGAFYIVFETENASDFYWARAEKQDYENSSWVPLDGGSSNTVTITMNKVVQ